MSRGFQFSARPCASLARRDLIDEHVPPSQDQSQLIRFNDAAIAPVTKRMRALLKAQRGWVNFHPLIEDEDGDSPAEMAPVRPGVLGLFSGRGPAIPVATWVPGEKVRKGTAPDSIGIQHGSGPKAARRLREAGITAPASWRVLADHPKRGLVVQIPSGSDPEAVLTWLIAACRELSTVPLPNEWAAIVHDS